MILWPWRYHRSIQPGQYPSKNHFQCLSIHLQKPSYYPPKQSYFIVLLYHDHDIFIPSNCFHCFYYVWFSMGGSFVGWLKHNIHHMTTNDIMIFIPMIIPTMTYTQHLLCYAIFVTPIDVSWTLYVYSGLWTNAGLVAIVALFLIRYFMTEACHRKWITYGTVNDVATRCWW